MLPFILLVQRMKELAQSLSRQKEMCYHVNSVSLLSDLETDRCNNENKKLLHKFYIMLTIHETFEFFSM